MIEYVLLLKWGIIDRIQGINQSTFASLEALHPLSFLTNPDYLGNRG